MSMALTYEILREIQRKETESAALSQIDADFYSQVDNFLSTKKNEAINTHSLLAIKEYENSKRIILLIQAVREEKIALLAVRGEKNPSGISKEERDMLQKLQDILESGRKSIHDRCNSEYDNPNKSLKIRIIKEVQCYTGLDNTVYGPFHPGEECALPEKEATWLLKAQMAVVSHP